MAERVVLFRGGSTELILPVTPDSYRVEKGIHVEVVNIHELGDINLFAYGTMTTIKLTGCLFPANSYPFARSCDPDRYIEQLERWREEKQRLRYIIGGTGVNIPVKIESFQYGEQDGTNDVYADLTLREHVILQPPMTSDTSSDLGDRAEEENIPEGVTDYVIQYGDTLSGICWDSYGDASQNCWQRLADYNGIPNPHMIPVGSTIQIPQPLP